MNFLTLQSKKESEFDSEKLWASLGTITCNGLIRKKIAPTESFKEWVQANYFIDGARFSFRGYEPLEQIYKDDHRDMVIMKSAQCGASEYAVARAFHFPLHYHENVFYGMPAKDQIKDFVQGRVDPRIDDSVRLQELITKTDNVDLKKVGFNFVYFRGSMNKKQIKTVDAALLILDEFDEMIERHISLMEKRIGDATNPMKLYLSVPSNPDTGIHREFLRTDQHKYHLQCPECGKWVHPEWNKNVYPKPTRDRGVRAPEKVKLVCECGGVLDRRAGGRWIALNPGAERRGYHVSKLIMPRTNLRDLWIEYQFTINLQDFFNSNLGLPYIAEGGKLDDNILNACKRSDAQEIGIWKDAAGNVIPWRDCTMGVDVGRLLNVRISMTIDGLSQAVWIGTVEKFEDLDKFMDTYDIRRCVIDGLPETRKATEFALRHPGKVFLAYYQGSDPHKTFEIKWKERPAKVIINRVRAMDETAQQFIDRIRRIPSRANEIKDYYDQMKAPQKIKSLDKNGNEVYKYLEGSKDDHYFHTEVYDYIAGKRSKLSVS